MKRILFIVFLLAVISGASWFIFSFKQNNNPLPSALDAVHLNADFIVHISDFSSFWDQIEKGNLDCCAHCNELEPIIGDRLNAKPLATSEDFDLNALDSDDNSGT